MMPSCHVNLTSLSAAFAGLLPISIAQESTIPSLLKSTRDQQNSSIGCSVTALNVLPHFGG
jgi:hypothetical protein